MKPVLLTLLLLTLFRPAAAQTYTITDLGNFDPAAINNVGQVVGEGTLWEGGKITVIPRLVFSCHAEAINNRGQIIGTSGSSFLQGMEEVNSHAFLWQNGLLRDLGKSEKALAYAYPNAINDQGQIVGESYPYPFLWRNGHFTRLKMLPKKWPDGTINSVATGINDHGQIIGFAYELNGESHAILWQSGRLIRLARLRNGRQGRANAINEQGQIVGASGVANSEAMHAVAMHAVLWQNGKCLDLGLLPGEMNSEAFAINNAGQVVGEATPIAWSRYNSRAFLWRGGRMLNLTSLLPPHSGWQLDSACGINDRGQIIGNGTHHGKPRGFLLSPKL